MTYKLASVAMFLVGSALAVAGGSLLFLLAGIAICSFAIDMWVRGERKAVARRIAEWNRLHPRQPPQQQDQQSKSDAP